jgi:hypothetical protein
VVAARVVEDVPMKIQRNTNRPVEIGHLIPQAPPQNAMHTIQINDV